MSRLIRRTNKTTGIVEQIENKTIISEKEKITFDRTGLLTSIILTDRPNHYYYCVCNIIIVSLTSIKHAHTNKKTNINESV